MRITKDDPKLIDYVLDELSEQEKRMVEHAIETDDTVRQAVDEIRAAVTASVETLCEEPVPGLTDEQKASIFAEAEVPPVTPRNRRWSWLKGMAAAASFVLVAGLTWQIVRSLDRAGDTASTVSPAVQLAQDRVSQFPEGWERFLITDINNPAGSAQVLENLDYENPQTQRQIEKIASRLDRDVNADASRPAVQRAPSDKPKPAAEPPSARPESIAASGSMYARMGDEPSGVAGSRIPAKAAEDKENTDVLHLSRRMRKSGMGVSSGNLRESRSSRMQSDMVADAIPDDPREVHWPGHNTEEYDDLVDNPFMEVVQNPLSTFSIDVDTASYSNMRRFLNRNAMPPASSVRIEELINYFTYDYDPPDGDDPFSANVEVATCPWDTDHRLVRVGLKGWEIEKDDRPASNLVFLIDVSGSMSPVNKLPLLQKSMRLLVDQLDERDRVAIAVYAGASGLVLPSTSADDKETIIESLERLKSGGSTNGGAGIQLAYDVAVQNFIEGGVNRVILATDGDFNVGTTSQGELVTMIEEKAESGVFLSVLGFGMGNLNDSTLEKLADKGNGNYAYIDTLNEGRKVLVEEMGGTLITIAKDVKIQIEFNPAEVAAYRLIGYENRMLRAEDFNDDTKDAGEIGAGHTVTALYEIVPAGREIDTPSVDPLKYQRTTELTDTALAGQLMTLKLRYKQPDGDTSKLLEFEIVDNGTRFDDASEDFKFAASVSAFGMILRDSEHKGGATFDTVLELADDGVGDDTHGYRREFISLVKKAKQINR